MHSRRGALAVLVGVTMLSSVAAAQCTEGRVSGPSTQGQCCWPGQAFSSQLGRCTGAPQCPSGMAAEGETCVSVGTTWEPPAPEGPSTAPPPPPQAPTLSWALVSPDIGVGVVNPRTIHSGSDMGLVIGGAITLATGYVAAILAGVFDELGRNCAWGSCGAWPLGFVPIVGGVLAGTVAFSGPRYSTGWGFGMGIPSAVAQSLGLTLLIIGLVVDHVELVPFMESQNVLVLPFASADAGGLSVTMEL